MFVRQFRALLRKNVLLLSSAKVRLAFIMLAPLFGVVLISIMSNAKPTPDSYRYYYGSYSDDGGLAKIDSRPVEQCQWFDVYARETEQFTHDCTTILYSPVPNATLEEVKAVNEIMKLVADQSQLSFHPAKLNSQQIPETVRDADVYGVSSTAQLAAFHVAHPGRAAGIVMFQSHVLDTTNPISIDVLYNMTGFGNNNLIQASSIQTSIGRAIASKFGRKGTVSIKVSKNSFDTATKPEEFFIPNYISGLAIHGTIGSQLGFVYVLSILALVNLIAREKQQGLIGSLRVVGMPMSLYFLSWSLVYAILSFISTLLAMALAYALEMDLLSNTDFLVPFITLWIGSLAMFSVASVLIATATRQGLLNILWFGFMIATMVIAGIFAKRSMDVTSPIGAPFHVIMVIFPWANVQKIFSTMGSYNLKFPATEYGTYNTTTFFQNVGAYDRDLNQTVPLSIYNQDTGSTIEYYAWSDATNLLIMLIQMVVYYLVALYLFYLVPSNNGIVYRPWFIFDWMKRKNPINTNEEKPKSIKIRDLTRKFKDLTAVDHISMEIQSGQIYVLLGHNGAGKTTLINMLTGKISPTSGDAEMLGYSVEKNVAEIQKMIGYVPQHDILWMELSAFDHIRLFVELKGLDGSKEAVDEILQRVYLSDSSQQNAGSYSGGMKRRLSIALAGVGDPAVLFMDEPTTGIDPFNRRRIWKLIEELKKDRIVVLTTHLMQEADVLGDQIGIMDHGSIQASGTALSLKSSYGSGYSLNILTDPSKVDLIYTIVHETMGQKIDIVNSSGGSVAIGIEKSLINLVPELTRRLEEQPGLIREWSVSQSTLEEVFLRLAKPVDVVVDETATQIDPIQPNEPTEIVEIQSKPVTITNAQEYKITRSGQVGAILRKLFLLQRRSIVSFIAQILLPILLMAGTHILIQEFSGNNDKIQVAPNAFVTPKMNYDIEKCLFEWDIYAKMYPSGGKWFSDAEVAKTALELQIPQRHSSDVQFKLSSVDSSHSNLTIAESVSKAYETLLHRSSLKSTQHHVDAMCENCGPCQVNVTAAATEDGDSYLITVNTKGAYISECYPGETDLCSASIVRLLTFDPDFLPANKIEQFRVIPTRRDALQSIHRGGIISRDDWHARSICDKENDVDVWLSGPGAAEMSRERLDQVKWTILDTDVNTKVLENQKYTMSKAVVLKDSDYPKCVPELRRDAYGDVRYYIDSSNPVPLNILTPTAFCNRSDPSLAANAYSALFPDAGIHVKTFINSPDALQVEMDLYTYPYVWDKPRDPTLVLKPYCDLEDQDEDGTCRAPLSCSNMVQTGRGGKIDAGEFYMSILNFVSPTKVQSETNDLNSFFEVEYEPAAPLASLSGVATAMLLIVMLILPSTISTIVFEKQGRYVFALLLNQLSLFNYWIALYLYHGAWVIGLSTLGLVTGLICGMDALSSGANPGYIILMVLVCCHSQFGLIVFISAIFKKHRLAAVLVSILIIMTAVTWMVLAGKEKPEMMNHFPTRISTFTPLGFARGIFLALWGRNYTEIWEIVGVMLLTGSLQLMLGIFLHGATGVGAIWKCKRASTKDDELKDLKQPLCEDPEDVEAMDLDVRRERERTLRLSPSETAIKLDKVSKTFPGPPAKTAVVDLTMGMSYGECFGLLGPNGAGKTTAISMLVGQIDPSTGKAYVNGYDSVSERREALLSLGIVPQFDVLYDDLTVGEHLALFAAVKGVEKSQVKDWTLEIARLVALDGDLFNRVSKKLSGGMRRRLSIAIALLNDPKVLFLDEPTTGLDPEMKRMIWTIVENLKSAENKCIVLTTHAMDEAEALCSRIGIMAQGTLRCVGTLEQLQNRFNARFELSFTLMNGSDHDSLRQHIKTFCPSVMLLSTFGQTRVFTIQKKEITIQQLFTMLIQGQEKGFYTEWGVSHTSLDEVFCAITAQSEGVDI